MLDDPCHVLLVTINNPLCDLIANVMQVVLDPLPALGHGFGSADLLSLINPSWAILPPVTVPLIGVAGGVLPVLLAGTHKASVPRGRSEVTRGSTGQETEQSQLQNHGESH